MKIISIMLSTNTLCSDREPFISSEDDKSVTLTMATDLHTAVIEVILTEDDLMKINAFVDARQERKEGFGL